MCLTRIGLCFLLWVWGFLLKGDFEWRMYICKKVSAGVRRMWGNICVSCVVGELDESDSLCDMYMSGMCALRESAYEWVLALKKKRWVCCV